MITLAVTDAKVWKGETFGEIIADGYFAGAYRTNLVIYCKAEQAKCAVDLVSATGIATVELDIGGNVIGIRQHECDLDSGCCDICGKWANRV